MCPSLFQKYRFLFAKFLILYSVNAGLSTIGHATSESGPNSYCPNFFISVKKTSPNPIKYDLLHAVSNRKNRDGGRTAPLTPSEIDLLHELNDEVIPSDPWLGFLTKPRLFSRELFLFRSKDASAYERDARVGLAYMKMADPKKRAVVAQLSNTYLQRFGSSDFLSSTISAVERGEDLGSIKRKLNLLLLAQKISADHAKEIEPIDERIASIKKTYKERGNDDQADLQKVIESIEDEAARHRPVVLDDQNAAIAAGAIDPTLSEERASLALRYSLTMDGKINPTSFVNFQKAFAPMPQATSDKYQVAIAKLEGLNLSDAELMDVIGMYDSASTIYSPAMRTHLPLAKPDHHRQFTLLAAAYRMLRLSGISHPEALSVAAHREPLHFVRYIINTSQVTTMPVQHAYTLGAYLSNHHDSRLIAWRWIHAPETITDTTHPSFQYVKKTMVRGTLTEARLLATILFPTYTQQTLDSYFARYPNDSQTPITTAEELNLANLTWAVYLDTSSWVAEKVSFAPLGRLKLSDYFFKEFTHYFTPYLTDLSLHDMERLMRSYLVLEDSYSSGVSLASGLLTTKEERAMRKAEQDIKDLLSMILWELSEDDNAGYDPKDTLPGLEDLTDLVLAYRRTCGQDAGALLRSDLANSLSTNHRQLPLAVLNNLGNAIRRHPDISRAQIIDTLQASMDATF